MTSDKLVKMATAAAVIREVVGCDFECHARDDVDWPYGKGALLILVHHPGEKLRPYVDYECREYGKVGRLATALGANGFFVEDCTGWYSAVYEIPNKEKTDGTDEQRSEA